jgi:nucleotide-binding universal stress UspA family protein
MADLIVGYDRSDCARAALGAAIELARALGDRVVVAYAEAPPDSLRGEEWKVHRQALREIGEEALAEALERVRAAGVEVDSELVTLKPAEALLALAGRRDARMIVVGTHGEGPIAGAILGSVPHKLLHRSPVPVLVVPAPD